MLTGFLVEEDRLQGMLDWLAEELMRVEAEARVGAEKAKHSKERVTHFSGYRVRKLYSRVGTLYLMVSKVRKGGYIPFFLADRKGGLNEPGPGGLYQRGLDAEDRAFGQGSRDREPLSFSGLGDSKRVG